MPAIRAGGRGGRMQCPCSQQQLVPATAPRGHPVPGCSACSRECRCKSAFVLPEFPMGHLPVPDPISQRGHLWACVMSPCAPRWKVGRVPFQSGNGVCTARICASPLPLVPAGPQKAISAPEVPKPQVGEVEMF